MRKPLLLPLSLLSVWGEQKELSDSQLAELYRYNNRPTLQMRVQQKLRSYANISPSRARQIAKECRIGERPGAIRLVRERKRLYYRIVGDEAVANVNALDGELIECKRRNR
ncbi:hypothetical protein [Hydrogenimonas sp.]